MRLAKVDATVEKKLAERYDVVGYPSLKLFRPNDEKPVECRPERLTAGEMFVWLRKKIGSPVDRLDSVEEAKKLIDISIVVVFGFFKVKETLHIKLFFCESQRVFTIGYRVIWV